MDVKCQNCGSENAERHIYCERCGAVIVRPLQIDEAAIRGPKQDAVRAIDRRSQTDVILPVTLVWLIVVLTIVSIVAYIGLSVLQVLNSFDNPSDSYWRFLPSFATLSIGSLIADLITFYVYYVLVKRQNDHYARERELRTAIISLIRAAATTPDRQNLVEGDLMTMGMLNSVKERYRRPWFWVLAAALPMLMIPVALAVFIFVDYRDIPLFLVAVVMLGVIATAIASLILQLVMFRFLGNTMFDHAMRWNTFAIAARTALSKLGFPAGKPFKIHSLPDRSFILYLVLTIFTGIFVYYWIYALVKDPNEHFTYQWEFEDNLLSAIGGFRLPAFKDGTWVP